MSNNRQYTIKTILKFAGIFLLLAGFTATIVGCSDFFQALSTSQAPKLLWCMFIGLPLMGLGSGFSVFAFKKELTSAADETQLHSSTLYCPACGKQYSESDAYCSGCGNKL